MGKFIKPSKLNPGDTVATVSLSGGRAGDPDMRNRYDLGKRRLEEIFGLSVVAMPNSMRGNEFLYKNPKARADDLMEALIRPEIKGIFLNMGGDDGIRLLPFIDFDVIRNNPKVFMGFSDGTTFHHMFAFAGVTSFYGANVLATIAEPVALQSYTVKWVKKALFSAEPMGMIEPCASWAPIDWQSTKAEELTWTKHEGYRIYQGSGAVTGHLMGGCGGPLRLMLGTSLFPKKDMWKGCILFLEDGLDYGTKLAGIHSMRALAAAGVFREAKALVLPRLPEEIIVDVILKVLHEEGLSDLPVLSGVEFAHSNPMTVLPIGVETEINCDHQTITILESGVSWDLL